MDRANSRFSRSGASNADHGAGLAAAMARYRYTLAQPDANGRTRLRAVLTLARYFLDTLDDHERALTLLDAVHEDFAICPDFVRLYARCLWRGNTARKAAAIACLEHVVANGSFHDEAERLEFLCSLMVHKTQWITAQRDALKARLQGHAISKAEYTAEYAEQTRQLDHLYSWPGLTIYEKLRHDELRHLGHVTKLQCLSALAYFMEICLRRKKYAMIDDIFSYVFTRMRPSYHEMFRKKLERINKYYKEGAKSYEDYLALRAGVGDHDAVLGEDEPGPPGRLPRLRMATPESG